MEILKYSNVLFKDIEYYKTGFKDFPILACDTETVNGKIWTIQFYDGIGESRLHYASEETIVDLFLDEVERCWQPNLTVWFHYSRFDLPIIFHKNRDIFCYDDSLVKIGEHQIRFVSAKTWFVDCGWNKKWWGIRDSYHYFNCGLDKAAKDLGLEIGKLPKPEWLGDRKWKTEEERIQFEAYAKQDVVVLYQIVNVIKDLHRKYDCDKAVSLPDLASKIFRTRFMKERDCLKVESFFVKPALNSYHGGKTETYVETPTLIHDIYEYDLKSAYPWAMATMPNFFDCEYRQVKEFVKPEGIYQVSGQLSCSYRGCYQHNFTYHPTLVNTWVTGYELQPLLQRKEFVGEILDGYIVEWNQSSRNPLTDYVWHFFKEKERADREKNKTDRTANKLFMNALYGKLIARLEHGEEFVGGSLFHPFMATLITGKVRGLLHELEHKYEVIHTSTDAIITKNSECKLEGMNGLGSLVKEYSGSVYIFRKKLYLIIDKYDKTCHHDWREDPELHYAICQKCNAQVVKAACHGFQGSVLQLLTMFQRRKKKYVVKRMVRLKEALKSRDPERIPFLFQLEQKTLNIDWSKFKEV